MSSREIDFFDTLYKKCLRKSKRSQHVILCCWYIIVAVGCVIPAQEILLGNQSEYALASWLPAAIVFGVSFATSSCIGQFRTYEEENIKNHVGSVIQLLQYHPMDKRKIQREKIKYQYQFLLKLSFFCLLVQLLGTYMSLGKIEWLNIAFIFVLVFFIPGMLVVLGTWIKTKVLYGE
ncbi:MAG: hypothetical protein IJ958_01615 [Agathobacter sp.]|nr:hypothetical protein [Agathobacter sp.]